MGRARHVRDLDLIETFPFPFNSNLPPRFFPQCDNVSLQFALVRLPTFIYETRVIFCDDVDRISLSTALTIIASAYDA